MGENDDPLETIYHALLIIFYVALPLLMTILRCFTMKNIPKVDLVFLFFAITFWFWIVWFSTILTNDLVSWGGANLIPGWDFAGVCFMIIGPSVSFLVLLAEPFHAWSCGYIGYSDVKQPLPIMFDSSSRAEFKQLVDLIQETGPTLVAGAVMEAESYKVPGQTGQRISAWQLAGWDEFQYKSWVNLHQPHPYLHEDELEAGKCIISNCRHYFSDLEDALAFPGPLVVKSTLEVIPANDATAEEYRNWRRTYQRRLDWMADGGTKAFREEMVTVDWMGKSHSPSQMIPSIQLPSLVKKRSRFSYYAHVPTAASNKFFYRDKPWWLSKRMYAIFTCLLLSSVYRVFYWTAVRVVKLNFRKSFNAKEDSTYTNVKDIDPKNIQPYQTHVEDFEVQGVFL